MNRTLRSLSAGALLVALTACTAGAPTGATLAPLTSAAPSASAEPSEPSTDASTAPSPSDNTTPEAPIETPAAQETVPAEASALPLPTEQVNIPADNPQEEADRAAIEAVWRQVWDLYKDGYNMTEPQIVASAEQLMSDPLKDQMVQGLLLPESRIAVADGDVIVHPYWYQAVAGQNYAVMGDCIDFSGMVVSDRGTGTNSTRGSANVDTVGHFVRTTDGRWHVWQMTTITGSECAPS